MLETAKSPFLPRTKNAPDPKDGNESCTRLARVLFSSRAFTPISKINKLLIALIIFIISSASGELPFFDDTNMANNAQVLAETTTHDNAPKNTPELPKGKIGQFQIRQIAIGQKNSHLPTATPTPTPLDTSNATWGAAKKIDTYTMTIQPDSSMGTAQEMLDALNSYRQQQGKGVLAWDDKLAGFANSRAEYFSQKGNLDGHAGFSDYLNNQDGFRKLGFHNVGENSSIGFTLQAIHLIEWVYAGDAEHNNNQLNSDWQYVGIGVNDNATDFVFAGNKL